MGYGDIGYQSTDLSLLTPNLDALMSGGRKVWYGTVYGMVWYGMVWYGMVWYGMVWCGVVWYGMVWYGTVWYGMVWYGMHLV